MRPDSTVGTETRALLELRRWRRHVLKGGGPSPAGRPGPPAYRHVFTSNAKRRRRPARPCVVFEVLRPSSDERNCAGTEHLEVRARLVRRRHLSDSLGHIPTSARDLRSTLGLLAFPAGQGAVFQKQRTAELAGDGVWRC